MVLKRLVIAVRLYSGNKFSVKICELNRGF
jgi:hypothetical protein